MTQPISFWLNGEQITAVKVNGLKYTSQTLVDFEPGADGDGVRGETSVEFECTFISDAARDAFDNLVNPPMVVRCTRCGQGRLYSTAERAWLAANRRWARHVCPRGSR